MSRITQYKNREIIDDFAKEIRTKKTHTARPSKEVINFRDDQVNSTERDVVQVPIELLRFRKDNGRIASNVLDYERTRSPLDERDENAQGIIRDFLRKKDAEKTNNLSNMIRHEGQRQPAIITCDGFLINGNRRKMVMDQLRDESPSDDRFKYMKVVILPGKDEEGGPPTLLEIEQIENRYQLQAEGKSEYHGLDRALSIRRKIEIGLTRKAQVTDDPQHASKPDAGIQKAINEMDKNYLKPLECIDRYLTQFKMDRQYHAVSTGVGDPEGRWQAFLDYSNSFHSKFSNTNYQIENQIGEEEIGDIEAAAFNIIRLRNIPGMSKVHQIMRDLPKYCTTSEGKKNIINISKKVEPLFSEEDREIPTSTGQDKKWKIKNQENIIFYTKKAKDAYDNKKEKETPIELLDAALKKLQHKDMKLSDIHVGEYGKARKLASDIQRKANEIESEIYDMKKKFKCLVKKSK